MITVNAMGDNCPIPVIKTKKAMQALTGPETIEVLVDNEIAVQNVTKMASASGGQVSSEKVSDGEFKITVQMEGSLSVSKYFQRRSLTKPKCSTYLFGNYYSSQIINSSHNARSFHKNIPPFAVLSVSGCSICQIEEFIPIFISQIIVNLIFFIS